jgi:hypothetical protein
MFQGDVSMCYGFTSPALLGPNFPVQDDRACFYDYSASCPQLLQGIALRTSACMWFMYAGASHHFSNHVETCLMKISRV